MALPAAADSSSDACTEKRNDEPCAKKCRVASAFTALSQHTVPVADTADFGELQGATDATTNPSLICKVVMGGKQDELVLQAIATAKDLLGDDQKDDTKLIPAIMNQLILAFGLKILKIIPGRLSVEVDPSYAFDVEKSIARAKEIVEMFKEKDISSDRLLIKLPSTWEGIRAADQLEKANIQCNLTLLFGFSQAVACAEAGVTLISPFVGRITDWYSKQAGGKKFDAEEDPGVLAVRRIFNYYRKHGYPTVVMGASFRSKEQVMALCGCDKLTIPPSILKELIDMEQETMEVKLTKEIAMEKGDDKISIDEPTFRWQLNEDPMATELLSAGIRNFEKDWQKLKGVIRTNYLKKE